MQYAVVSVCSRCSEWRPWQDFIPLSVVVVFFLNVNKYFQQIPPKNICDSSRTLSLSRSFDQPLGIQRFPLSLAKYCVTKIGFRIWLFSMSQIELNSFTRTRESILFVLEKRLHSFKHNIGLGKGTGYTGVGDRYVYYANKGTSVSTLLSHIVHSVKMAACSACSRRSFATVSQQAETHFPWYSSAKRQRYGKTGNKNVNLFFNSAAKRVKKRCCAFYHSIRLLQVAWIQTSDWIKLRGSHAIHGDYVTWCKTSLPWVKRSTWKDFVAKRRTTLYFLQKLVATCSNLICCKTGLFLGS